ncbi:MAG: hypothetical protein QOE78_2435, partial [Alphaproteobacteria bacterium]|nr:hypothetical protein [Alphaproteobacteria bacterium]
QLPPGMGKGVARRPPPDGRVRGPAGAGMGGTMVMDVVYR